MIRKRLTGYMKKITSVALGVAAVLTAGVAVASSPSEVSFHLGKNLFVAGNDVMVTDKVDGDLYVAGRTVRVDGDVAGDLMFGAMSVTVNSNVGGAIRGGGQTVNINGSVGKSVVVGATEANLNAGTNAAALNDVMIGAATAFVGRPVTGDLAVGADSLQLQKPVSGAATLKLNALAADDAATIAGAVKYYGATANDRIQQRLEQLAPTRVTFVEVATNQATVQESTTMLRLAALLVVVFSIIATGWLMQVTAGGVMTGLVNAQRKQYLLTLVMGLVFFPLVGVVLFILTRLVVLAPLAFAIAFALPLWIMVGMAAVYQNIGDMVRRGKMDRPAASVLAGGIVVLALSLIPFLSGILTVVILLLALGSLVTNLLNRTGLIKAGK